MTKEIALIPAVKKELTPFEQRVSTISIIDEKSMREAADVRTELKTLLSKVVEYKETKTKPLNQALKVIRSETKPLESAIEEALSTLNRKMTAYQTEAERIAEEKREKIAARVGEGKGYIKPETAVAKMAEVDAPSNQVGTVKFKEVRKFEVMELAKLPVEFILADEVAIRKAMLSGIPVLGVRYYTERVPTSA